MPPLHLLSAAESAERSALIDPYGRAITYLRLALTDLCNLRCTYCMPAAGLPKLGHNALMRYEELNRLLAVLIPAGIRKVRITGGEPFVRKGSMDFIRALPRRFPRLTSVNITTNGVDLAPRLALLKKAGIHNLNISLDALDRELFHAITRRDHFERVMETIARARALDFHIKINVVLMRGVNENQIPAFVDWARREKLTIRFIEQMPFNASGENDTFMPAREILEQLRREEPALSAIPGSATAALYSAPGFSGALGIIAAYTRTFCGSCDRLRLTPTGGLQTCLYAAPQLNVRDMMRAGATDGEILAAVKKLIARRGRDGFEAEKKNNGALPSMAQIGG